MRRATAGVSLIEMTIATALGAVAVVGIVNLVCSMMWHQSATQGDLRVQTGSVTAARIIERDLRQTSYLVRPSQAGAAGQVLEGCVNAAPAPGSAGPAVLDPDQPVRGYALCLRAGALYYHSAASCPPSYVCGEGGTILAGSEGGRSVASASFVRPSAASSLVEADITVVSGDSTMTTHASAVIASSPGSGQ